MYLTAITGGIGSGKSVVSNVLAAMGYPVYDCDSRAKQLMDSSDRIKDELKAKIDSEVILPDGSIDRPALSRIVFSDAKALNILNSIVHSVVRDDILRWKQTCKSHERGFVETAILYQSGLDGMADEVWEVTAPMDVRIARVMARNGVERDAVEARINSQCFVPERPHPHVCVIDNAPDVALLPQIEKLLKI